MLTAVEIPKPLAQFVRFYKVSKRRLDDISTVAAAMALDLENGRVTARPLRVWRRRRHANQSRRSRKHHPGPTLERRGGGTCPADSRPIAAANERSSRVEGVPAGSLQEPDRKVSVGAPAMKTAGTPLPHESARGHVTGEALYVDDLCGRFPQSAARLAGAVRRMPTRS